MIKTIKARMNKSEEEGFTLIELLVVVLILGILMAIAIPTFLSLTSGAKTNAAESDLTTASQDEAVYLTQNGVFDTTSSDTTATQFSAANKTAMASVDPGVNWVSTTPGTAGTKSVGIYVTSNSTTSPGPTLLLAELGQDGNEYWVKDVNGTLTYAETTATIAMTTGPASGDFASSWKSVTAAAS